MRFRLVDVRHQVAVAIERGLDGRVPELGLDELQMRTLKECPWERRHALRAAITSTRLQMLLRGQNVVGYRNYPVQRAAAGGIDVFRIFDAMNDLRNMKTAIEAALRTEKTVEGTICYTVSPSIRAISSKPPASSPAAS